MCARTYMCATFRGKQVQHKDTQACFICFLENKNVERPRASQAAFFTSWVMLNNPNIWILS